MANLNKVMLIGNLTRDPEVKYTPKGSAVAEFGLAINRSYTTESGEKKEEVTFVDVALWGKLAELAQKYLVKGKQVYIEGRLKLDSWDDKQSGQKRSKLTVTGEQMQFIGARGEDGGEGGGGRSYGGNRGESQEQGGGGGGDDYDQRPQRSQPQGQRSGGGGGGGYQQGGGAPQRGGNSAPQRGGGGRPQPAPANNDVDDDDDIPF